MIAEWPTWEGEAGVVNFLTWRVLGCCALGGWDCQEQEQETGDRSKSRSRRQETGDRRQEQGKPVVHAMFCKVRVYEGAQHVREA